MSVDTTILDRIREYRIAARHAVEATDAGDVGKCLALVKLGDLARSEPDLTTRVWAERAIWAEAESFLLGEERHLVGDPWEQRQRQLRAGGYDRCPRCLSHVLTPDELESEQRKRDVRIAQLERKQQAIHRD
jgi:hypothetical protein